MSKHVLVQNVNGNPRDRRMWQIGCTLNGTWSRRAVRVCEDDYGTEYIVMGGIEYDLEDVNYIEED